MDQFIKDLQRLKTDQYHRLTIYDKRFGRPLYKDFGIDFINKQFQSIDNFIESIKNNGTKEIVVHPRRANGSVTKAYGQTYDVILVQTNEPYYTQTKLNFETPTNKNMENTTQGLNGFAGMNGLMGADVSYRYMDYPKVIEENKELKSENKTLKEKNEQLSRDNFKLELENKSDDKKREGNQQLLGMLAPLLAPVAEKLLAPQVGLSQPGSKFDNQINQVLDAVGVLLTKSEDFYIELDDLMKKYGSNN